VSSTAVTLTFVKQSHEPHANGSALAGGILLAWAVMFARVVVAATLVHPPLFASLVVPFGAMLVACSVATALCFARGRRAGAPTTATGDVPLKNPFSLVAAGKFALLFGAVQLLLKLAQTYLPQSGTYVVAAVAGLTDVDAITLSMAQQAKAQADATAMAVLAILLAAASNTIVKAAMAAGMGHRRLRRPVLVSTAAVLVAGAAALLLT
jgi:uncharacterized membrane protein (DUF4010 family)